MKITHSNFKDIYLQKISLADVNLTYVDWLNDPETNQYLETRFKKQTIDSVRDFVSSIIKNNQDHLFTIRTSKDKKHIGNIKIGNIAQQHGTGFISLFIGDKLSRNNGYAKQAITLICQHAFTTLKLRKLTAGVYDLNCASKKIFLKSGFEYEATFKNHYIFEGTPCDLIFLSLFTPDRAQ